MPARASRGATLGRRAKGKQRQECSVGKQRQEGNHGTELLIRFVLLRQRFAEVSGTR